MTEIKNYFKQQFQLRMFSLEYETPSDFYLSSFQRGLSCLPLMLFRGFLLLGCIGIVITSLVMTAELSSLGYWPIYLTHWGLVLITLTCGFAFAVSLTNYLNGSIDTIFGLPWYYKVYWILYSISIPVAFFITVFYWSFLTNENQEFAPNFVLDVFIHAINSVVMFALLITARQPTNLLHFYLPCLIAIVYIIFTLIYYFCGGTDPFGHVFIYPVLDWSNPGVAVVTIVFSLILTIILYCVCALLTIARDAFGRFSRRDSNNFIIAN